MANLTVSDDRVVLLTGCSSGIGAESVRYFSARGWRVVATMRDPAAGAALNALPGVEVARLDVTEPENITAIVAATLQKHDRLDVLVNNAGYGLFGCLEAMAMDDIRAQFETNVFGLIRMTQAVLPHFRKARTGTIVQVSSIGGRLAFPLASPYHATKWGIEGLSESLRFELKPFGVRVKIVEPGGIKTDFGTRSIRLVLNDDYRPLGDPMLKVYRDRMDRLPGPEKVAATIYRAAIDTSSRLRFPVHGEPFMFLRRVLPDFLWTRLIAGAFGLPKKIPE